ncbi:Sugar (pentulose or hexulose) kinase [Pedobacter suwonensis]|uniref:Sugar (Pentulose or hexulose) kinase n=1 Tax=Pedobacter suwonensis TaxID=332999 RepID=A0A1I0T5Z0_9SPHI|nr:FGGY family carbohydrate kinase [Pedobacter suwonensis]SFA47214.1 Sugar (pentulose or hexulose) kinase [Pedobacter suwonensis]
MPKPVIAIFDVGKTNKKLFLIDENYQIVYERSARFVETVDEDGEPCENLESLRSSVYDSLHQVLQLKEFDVKAVNFSTYGASFVYLDENGEPLTPLYNYLKSYPEALKNSLYVKYGGEEKVSLETASPVLGSLNSGMQLYRLKNEKPEIFNSVKWALHLPQYLSYLITGKAVADITSIGCHTQLWDFNKNQYHEWVSAEEIDGKFGTFAPADSSLKTDFEGKSIQVGVGLHDSSAALIPYLANFNAPFVLISTGTWCISLNPFNQEPLTAEELKQDCLCYMHFKGKAIKASRIFAGYEHEVQLKRIAGHFDRAAYLFKHLKFNPAVILRLANKIPENSVEQQEFSANSAFPARDLSLFQTAEEAYHQLIFDLIKQQVYSLKLVLNAGVKRVFVDGGFGKNAIYMHLLAIAIPEIEVYASSVSQATAIGTALAINDAWNKNPAPTDMIQLKYYSAIQRTTHV